MAGSHAAPEDPSDDTPESPSEAATDTPTDGATDDPSGNATDSATDSASDSSSAGATADEDVDPPSTVDTGPVDPTTAADGAHAADAADGAEPDATPVDVPSADAVVPESVASVDPSNAVPADDTSTQVFEVNYRGQRRRRRRLWEAAGSIGVPILGVAAAVYVVLLMFGVSLSAPFGTRHQAVQPSPVVILTDNASDPSPSGPSPSPSESAKPSPSPSASRSAVRPPPPPPTTQPPKHTVTTTYEAEAPQNDRDGTQTTSAGSATVVHSIGNGASLIFKGVNVPASDAYTVTFYYTAYDQRSATIKVNGVTAASVSPPPTADNNTISTFVLSLSLKAGSNTIEVRCDVPNKYAPRIDKITVR